MPYTGYIHAFSKQMLKLARKKGIWEVFADYCRIEAVEILYLAGEASNNDAADHRNSISKYSKEEQAILKTMSDLTIAAIAKHPYQDLLGEVFMTHRLGAKHKDQYFTHPNICVFMSAVLAYSTEQEIRERGFAAVADTSCGSGAELLYKAGVVHNTLHMEPTNVLLLDGTDTDRLCADMCYIQLSANSLTGIVRWDNGLCHQDKCVMITPKYKEQLIWAKSNNPHAARFLIDCLSLKTG